VAKGIAVVLLALSVALTGLAIYQSSTAHAIRGPGALAVMADNTVWIATDSALVHASAAGHELESCPLMALGLSGSPSNLMRHPSGELVATQRDDATLYFFAAAGCQRLRTLTPQWPGDLARHGGRAINLAFNPDGRFAIATGGGDAVALFAADGAFIARSRPGTYRFTNGLWWRGNDLWTTDTNRSVLRLMDGESLREKSSVQVGSFDGAEFLGGADVLVGNPKVQAALAIYNNDMIEGKVVTVNLSGETAAVPGPVIFHPFRVAWQGDQLLVTDAASLKVLRWSIDRERLADFGDASLVASWGALARRRQELESLYWPLMAAGIASFAIAFAVALRTQRQQKASIASPLNLSDLGTPILSILERWRLAYRALGLPLLLPLAAFVVLRFAASKSHLLRLPASLTPGQRLLAVCSVALIVYGWAFFAQFRLTKRLRGAEFEPWANAAAVRLLKTQPSQSLGLASGESIRESFIWRVPLPTWVILTDRRMMMLGVFTRRMTRSYGFRELSGASINAAYSGDNPSTLSRLQRALSNGWLAIKLTDGNVLKGIMSSSSVAQRVVVRINQAAADAARESPRATPASGPLNGPLPSARKRLRDAAASVLIPGLGQWLQNRFDRGLMYFVVALGVLLFLVIPLTWFAVGPRAEVSTATLVSAYALQVIIAVTSAIDAYAAAA
jgi:hypothetical protein